MRTICTGILVLASTLTLMSQSLISRTAHVNIRSENNIKNIEADNYQVISQLNLETGEISFEGLLKSFEFKLGALDRIFASDKVNVKQYPKIKFEGKMTGLENADLAVFGEHQVTVDGYLYIWDEKRRTKATGTFTTIGDNKQAFAYSGFLMTIEDGSMDKIDEILEQRLPSLGLTTSSLGISKDINVLLDVTFSTN